MQEYYGEIAKHRLLKVRKLEFLIVVGRRNSTGNIRGVDPCSYVGARRISLQSVLPSFELLVPQEDTNASM